jgi:hypothetical protein
MYLYEPWEHRSLGVSVQEGQPRQSDLWEVKLNLNDLAKEITLQEGGKVNLSIAQVKEVMKILLTELANMTTGEVEDVLRRYRKY